MALDKTFTPTYVMSAHSNKENRILASSLSDSEEEC